ncbi:SRPBCC family protein [uncultured Phenylobacterium sp.]|uniref:SRPBCC family protein n=1 Tax=uncultured Phenylobacterium sp. TaxID=349273 RepID=UPI0025F1E46E|nr:SRPBCC family protein [uncultured Phenylobacterium sp.]
MFEISREVKVNAPPPAVWRVLTDFSGYRAWTKAVLVDGAPEVGCAMGYQLGWRTKSGVHRAVRFESKVNTAEPGAALIWTSGVPGILGLRFGFELRPADGGTAVRHYLQISGVAALFRDRLTRMYGPALGAVTQDLARVLAKTRLSSLRTLPDIRRRKRKR